MHSVTSRALTVKKTFHLQTAAWGQYSDDDSGGGLCSVISGANQHFGRDFSYAVAPASAASNSA